MSKKIFLTGAAGFIGFHLAHALAQRGDTVLGLDNFNAYYAPSLKKARAARLQEMGISVQTGDICATEQLRALFEQFAPTHCVHLAAQAGVRYSLSNPEAYLSANLNGFCHLLELLRLHPTIPLIYASSSSVYGTNRKVPFSETDKTDCPANLYGATKKANEAMAYAYHHLFNIPMTALRFFTVYGPYGRPDMAYYSFTKAITEGRPIEVYNAGKMRRDFTYIDDIIAGTIAAIDLSAPWEIFNLGNNEPQELMTLIALLEKHLNKKASLQFLSMQPGDMEETFADISHARDKLGFAPKVSLEDGVARFINWYLDNHLSLAYP